MGRDVDETIYIVFGDGLCYTLGTFDMNVFKIKISVFLPVSVILIFRSFQLILLCSVVSTHEIVDHIRVPYTFLD